MSFKFFHPNIPLVAFTLRYSLDSDYSIKQLMGIEDEIRKSLEEEMEKDTEDIKFRTLEYIENLFIHLQGNIEPKIKKLKQAHSLAFDRYVQEKKTQLQELSNFISESEDKITTILADLKQNFSQSDREFLLLILHAHDQLLKTIKVLLQSYQFDRYRRNTQIGNMMRTTSAILLVFFRLKEMEKHWEKASEEEKTFMSDLLIWDLDTLDHTTNTLTDQKSRLTTIGTIDSKLVRALLG